MTREKFAHDVFQQSCLAQTTTRVVLLWLTYSDFPCSVRNAITILNKLTYILFRQCVLN